MGKITMLLRLCRQTFSSVMIEGSVWWLKVRKTKDQGTEFPPDLLRDLLGQQSISKSPQGLAGRSSEEWLSTLGLSSLV